METQLKHHPPPKCWQITTFLHLQSESHTSLPTFYNWQIMTLRCIPKWASPCWRSVAGWHEHLVVAQTQTPDQHAGGWQAGVVWSPWWGKAGIVGVGEVNAASSPAVQANQVPGGHSSTSPTCSHTRQRRSRTSLGQKSRIREGAAARGVGAGHTTQENE